MRTINSVEEALDFYPAPAHRPALVRFGGQLQLYWSAMRDGLAAARAYHALTARGIPHQEAVQQIFTDHFEGR